MDWNAFFDSLINWLMNSGVKIVIALLVLFISFRIITLVTRKLTKKLTTGKHHADKTIVKTLMYVGGVALKVVVVITLVGYVGIDTSGLTALVASLGVTPIDKNPMYENAPARLTAAFLLSSITSIIVCPFYT